jgi:hypothetical protein
MIIVNLFDGELVIDHPWRKENSAPIFLVFDSIITNTINMIASPFHKRLHETNIYIAQRFLPARGFAPTLN